MNLDALVTKGRLPWSPSTDAHDLDVWYEYEYPYTGMFVARDATVLFSVMGGVESDTTVWVYTCLAPGEAEEFASLSFASVAELREFVEGELNGRQLVFALADDLLISSWAVSEEKGELFEVATKFLDQVLREAQGKLNTGTRFRAKLAQVDVAAHDLIEA
jgi:hypothetical protein